MSRKAGKNISKSRAVVEKRQYLLSDAVPLLQKVKFAKFDETVEVTLRLGVDPKHADQMVRGTVVLPHGLGRSKKVLVIASGDKVREAEAAGADIVGGEEMVGHSLNRFDSSPAGRAPCAGGGRSHALLLLRVVLPMVARGYSCRTT